MKADCDFALETFGLKHLFKVCACMEDGVKPDPKVRSQLLRLY
jgi:hypothetical protein